MARYCLRPDTAESMMTLSYPNIWIFTLFMVIGHDNGRFLSAFVSSVLLDCILVGVLEIHNLGRGDVRASSSSSLANDNDESRLENNHEFNADESSFNNTTDNNNSNNSNMYGDEDLKSCAFDYIVMRLPFELFAGYVFALASLYFNTFLRGFDVVTPLCHLVLANIGLVLLTYAGCWKRQFYGVTVALVWYLLGVVIELHTLTQWIYNEFSKNAILATQVIAGVASLILLTVMGVRVVKMAIGNNEGSNTSVVSGGEGNVSMDYVQA
mmetsp:Transcript_35630/g.76904  ORF Transcript_35630/g.76904 Transcript_35630/m.76904 type:complete len:268 (+) Transcript_35630:947-1750(+)